MERRFERNIGALSEAECKLLHDKTVFVAGCGGLGGHIIDMLLRVGVGHIRTADGDCFDESNLNRQLLSDTEVVGKSKSETAAAHAKVVSPKTDFVAFPCFVTAENAHSLIHGCDAVIDGLDNIASRKVLKAACDAEKIPYIFGAVSGWTGQAAVSVPGDGLIDTLYPADVTSGNKTILSFTPALCAAMQVSLCVKLLCGRDTLPGKLYYFDLLDMDFETLF